MLKLFFKFFSNFFFEKFFLWNFFFYNFSFGENFFYRIFFGENFSFHKNMSFVFDVCEIMYFAKFYIRNFAYCEFFVLQFWCTENKIVNFFYILLIWTKMVFPMFFHYFGENKSKWKRKRDFFSIVSNPKNITFSMCRIIILFESSTYEVFFFLKVRTLHFKTLKQILIYTENWLRYDFFSDSHFLSIFIGINCYK